MKKNPRAVLAALAIAALMTLSAGLGLLEMDTVFRGDKVQRQTRGVFGPVGGIFSGLSGMAYEGYEIHMGRTEVKGRPFCVLDSGRSAPASTVRELMECPRTVSAARLSGCKNYVPVQPGPEPGQVRIPLWGDLILQCAAPWREGVTTLGIRQSALRLAGEGDVNTFSGQVLRVVEDVSCLLAALGPGEDTAEDAVLWMELDRSERAVLEGAKVLQISVKPEELLLLA